MWFSSRFLTQVTIVASYTLLFSLFYNPLIAQDDSPCECAQRWDAGASWNPDGTIDDAPNSGPPNGIIRCGNSAETQAGIMAEGCVYDSTQFNINVDGLQCLDPNTGDSVDVIGPMQGCEVSWLQFDVRAFAGTYEYQIVTNDDIGWALYTSNEHQSGLDPSGLAGDCADLSLFACGNNFSSTFADFMVPSFPLPTNLYLAVWEQDCDTTMDLSFNFKARFGCGDGATCFIEEDSTEVTCNLDGTYTVVVDVFATNGVYIACDSNALTISDPILFTNVGSDPFIVMGQYVLTYPQFTDYNIILKDTLGNADNSDSCYINIAGIAPVCCVLETDCNYLDENYQCLGEIPDPDFAGITVLDSCSYVELSTFDVSNGGGCIGDTLFLERYYISTDTISGEMDTCIQVFTIVDNTPPTFMTIPADDTISCAAALVFGMPLVMDNCSGSSLTMVDDTIPGVCPNEYIVTRTWTAEDTCDNQSVAAQSITVIDDTAPVFTNTLDSLEVNCDEAVPFGNYIAVDDCGNVALGSRDSIIAGDCPNEQTIIRIWTATDECGNAATAVQVAVIGDNDPPEFDADPDDFAVSCELPFAFATPMAQDACGGETITMVDDTLAGACPQNYSITRTWTATDSCGNQATVDQTITIIDTTAPVFDAMPMDVTVDCDNGVMFDMPMASDNCGDVDVDFMDMNPTGDCMTGYSTTRIWMATDECGNVSTVSQTITILDDTPPTFTFVPDDQNLECNDVYDFGTPIAEDNCGDVDIDFEEDTLTGICPGNYSITRTWTAMDGCGNTATASTTITFSDTEAPVFPIILDLNFECNDVGDFTTPDVTDNCGQINLSFSDTTLLGNCPQEYTIVRTWIARDDCGNQSTLNQSLIVTDPNSPEFTFVPAGGDFSCDENVVWGMPTATDDCGDVNFEMEDDTTNLLCPVTIVRNWTATDECGNTATASATINIFDNTPPVFSTVLPELNFECDEEIAWALPNPTDNCSLVNLSFELDTVIGACPSEYTIIRTWLATDACGNESTTSQVANVSDSEAPVFTFVPDDKTVDCGTQAEFGTPQVSDNCGNVDLDVENLSTDDLCNEAITRIWTATDDCGNSATASQTIFFLDEEPPYFTSIIEDEVIDCTQNPVFTPPTAEDDCHGVTIDFEDLNPTGDCATGFNSTRVWKATDDCGNFVTASQTITVIDDTPPSFTFVPADFSAECDEDLVLAMPTATDDCGQTVLTVEMDTTQGVCIGNYIIIRTFTVTDACGNEATESQTITVADNTPPVFPILLDINAECDEVTNFTEPDVKDNCSNINITFSDTTIQGTCLGEYFVRRTWIATDDCGNQATEFQSILYSDNTPPEFTLIPGGFDAECGTGVGIADAIATDNCGNVDMDLEVEETLGTCKGEYTLTRTWTATDDCGNSSTAQQVINYSDSTPPIFTSSFDDVFVDCDGNGGFIQPTAIDNCSDVNISFMDMNAPGNCAGNQNIVRTWMVTDDCGNLTTATQNLIYQDSNPPVFTFVPPAATVDCNDTLAFGMPVVMDDCDNFTIDYQDITTNAICPIQITRTWTATDACGNTATASQTLTSDDNTPPVFSNVLPTMTISCSDSLTFDMPDVTDNCDDDIDLDFIDTNPSGNCDDGYTTTRIWTATDDCGNVSTVSQNVTIIDTEGPIFTFVPTDFMVECTDVWAFGEPLVYDNCGDVILIETDLPETGQCPSTVTRVWTATDVCGNKTTASQTVTIKDETPPVFTFVPADQIINCDEAPVFDDAVASDECGSVTLDDSDEIIQGNCDSEFTIIRTWTATDECGNSSTVTASIEIQNNNGLSFISIPSDTTISCSAPLNDAFGQPQTIGCGNVNLSVDDFENLNDCTQGLSVTRVWTLSDDCGNSIQAEQVVNIIDDTPPYFTFVPADITGSCGTGNPVNTGMAEAEDDCTGVTVTMMDNTTGGVCTNGIERIWIATDGCGNTATAVQNIQLDDTEPPAITWIDPILAGLNNGDTLYVDCNNMPTLNTEDVEVTDNCDNNPIVVFYDAFVQNGDCDADGFITWMTCVWSATDACGNSSQLEINVVIGDNTPPVFTNVPADTTIVCNAPLNMPTVEATDACTDVTIGFTAQGTTDTCGNQVILNIWTATDECGNESTAMQTVYVNNGTLEFLSVPADVTINCDEDAGLAFGEPELGDYCANVNLSFDDFESLNDCDQGLTITRVWTAADDCGNSIQAQQVVTLLDDMPPYFTNIPFVQVDCDANLDSIAMPTVADDCSAVTLTYVDSLENGTACDLGIIRNWLATDACGNTATAKQIISIVDDEAPVITFVDPMLVGLTDGDTLFVTCQTFPTFSVASVNATDNCDDDVDVQFGESVTNGDCIDDGFIQLYECYWIATDDCGNSTTETIYILVSDNTPPVFTYVPADTTVSCNAPQNTGQPTATDDCTGVTISFEALITNDTCGNSTILNMWTATDECGNSTMASQTVQVTNGTLEFLSVPQDVTVNCGDDIGLAFGEPELSDYCGNLQLSFDDFESLNDCTQGLSVTRVWTAGDNCGNTIQAQQVVTIIDDVPPYFTNVPNGTTACGTPGNIDPPTAEDDCGSVSLDYEDLPGNGTGLCAGGIIRLWTATDACGNTATAEQIIGQTDNEPPQISFANPVLPLGNNGDTLTFGCINFPVPSVNDVVATDNCDDSLDVSFAETNIIDGDCASDGFIRLFQCTWTATDDCGNTSELILYIKLTDEEPPVFTSFPNDTVLNCIVDINNLPMFGEPTVTDICHAPTVGNQDIVSNNTNCNYVITRIWTATDDCGNSTSQEQTITITDNEAPVFTTFIEEITYDCDDDIPMNLDPTVEDNCGMVSLTSTEQTVPGACNGQSIIRTWTATDECGNATTKTQTVHFTDMTPPEITYTNPLLTGLGNGDTLVVECNNVPLLDVSDVAITDNCDPAAIVGFYDVLSVDGDCATDGFFKLMLCKWTAYDACGNVSELLIYIKIVDTQGPTFVSIPPAETIDCGQNAGQPAAYPMVSDNCNGTIDLDWELVGTNGACTGGVIRVWTATDQCGNTSTASQMINLNDSEPPFFTFVPADVSINCDETAQFGTPEADDDCGSVTIDVTNEETIDGTCPDEYTVIRTWTATDACGNTATASQSINVVSINNLSFEYVPQDTTISCETPPGLAFGDPIVGGTCSDMVDLSFDEFSALDDCTQGLSITRVWTALDACGNSVQAQQVVNIIDNTPPVFLFVPADISVDCVAAPPFGAPVVEDVCSDVTLTFDDQTTTNSCGTVITRIWTASDICGNESTASQTIQVNGDDQAPVITFIDPALVGLANGDTIQVECSAQPHFDTSDVMVTDACSEDVIVSVNESFENIYDCQMMGFIKKFYVTYTAIDPCGNESQLVICVTTVDTTPPVFMTTPQGGMLDCPEDADLLPEPLVTDNCGTVNVTSQSDVSGNCNDGYTIIQTWTATDACGNQSTTSATYTVPAGTAPALSFDNPLLNGLSDGDTLRVECNMQPVFEPSDISASGCNVSIEVEETFGSIANCLIEDYIKKFNVTWTATNDCGNTSEISICVITEDRTPPIFTYIPPGDTIACGDVWEFGIPTAIDNCGDAIVTFTDTEIPGDCATGYGIVRTWMATDGCGNVSTASQTLWFLSDALLRPTDGLLVLPNPAVNDIFIVYDFKTQGDVRYQIYDMLGRLIGEQSVFVKPGKSRLHINVSHLPAATYVLALRIGELTRTEKFVKIQE